MQSALFDVFYKYVSPVCQGTQKISENKTLSLFLRTQISKNGGTMELIQICVLYDVNYVISDMWTHGTIRKLLSETMPDVFWT